ncbi:type I methionyl aminopeptidase [Candidatus Saccharibacteria bacterium]|nr:type I methionyl aminopeptidase [Candidatus Saccharibacteria bacterium]
MFTRVKTDEEIVSMRHGGRILASILTSLRAVATDGMTTRDIDMFAREELKKLGGKPSVLGYQGFSGGICTSLNDEVVHGVPHKKKILRTGDILSLDFCVTYEDMITDSAISFIVDEDKTDVPERTKRLLLDTERSLYAGIDAVKANVRTGDIGAAVEASLKPGGYGIVRDMVGHGVGHSVHEEPNIPNYGTQGNGPRLLKGMTIAIEPMVTLGSDNIIISKKDGWTVRTADKSLSAHFEHTVLITENGAEVLTE